MGFFLSIIYFVTYYLTPTTIFGPLAVFRIELILAVLTFLVSLPVLGKSFVLKSPQSLALIGLGLATILSVVIGMSWVGGGIPAFLMFIPNAFAFFLVCIHFDSMKKLKTLVLMMLFVCLFVIAQGAMELQRGIPANAAFMTGDPDEFQSGGIDTAPYLLGLKSDSNEWFYRLRGLGEINDPNDFAQVIVCVIPLVFIFWTRKKFIRNSLFVLLPISILLYGAFLTHSRSSMLALLVMAIVAARRRIGLVPSIVVAVGLFVAASALNFTGGRQISADAGEDRTALWGEGLELLKSHPIFGVGFGRMADFAGQTAHNTLVVCAAELGMFGLYFWSLFLFPTMRNVLVIASPEKVGEAKPIAVKEKASFQFGTKKMEEIDRLEICRLGRLVLISLTGFLVSAWFLSRAFVMTFFLLGGIAEVIFEMAWERGMVAQRMPGPRVFLYSGVMAISLILVMYVMLRVVNLMH
jgi:hypothetical protein